MKQSLQQILIEKHQKRRSGQTDKWTDRQADRHTNIHTERYTNIETDRQTKTDFGTFGF